MEEIKKVHSGEGCHHTCMDMHKLCPKSCCLIKCLFVVIVLVAVFAAGCMAGRREARESYGYEGYRGHHLMMYGADLNQESYLGDSALPGNCPMRDAWWFN